MKRILKNPANLLIMSIMILTMAFTLSCSSSDDDSDYEMLNGVWDRGDIVVTFNGSNAIFTEIQSNSGWQTVLNNGSIRIGDKKFKDIAGSNLKWTCQSLTYDAQSYIVRGWEDCTISMNANGQTITIVTSDVVGSGITTYTKVQ